MSTPFKNSFFKQTPDTYYQMKTESNVNNNMFTYVFAGAVLFIAAIAFTIANLPSIAMHQLSSVLIAAALGISSIYLLYTAIRHDKDRLSQI